VFGADAGVGLACAQRFAFEGAKVVAAALSETGASAAARAIEETTGAEAIGVAADASTFVGAKVVVDQAVATFGRVDVCFVGNGTVAPEYI
jgi:NAD(P)-dependent dehydrogenase (short-subunit alcohol dehydrogenase family)